MRNKVDFKKMWYGSEPKRKINVVCRKPWQDIFVRYIDYIEEIQSNWHEKRFTILRFGDTKIAKRMRVK